MPQWSSFDDDEAYQADMRRLEEEDLSPEGIKRQNELLLDQQRRFRHAADMAVEAWRPFEDAWADNSGAAWFCNHLTQGAFVARIVAHLSAGCPFSQLFMGSQ